MATAAQFTANRANAQHSTGPVTPEGKARVSQNAIRHGLTSKHLVIREDEQDEFAAFQQSLLDELAPQGAVETLTFHDLLHAAWNLHRFRRIETELSSGDAGDFFAETVLPGTPSDGAQRLGESALPSRQGPALDRLARYQVRAQRAYYRALRELRILQTNRALRAVKLEDPADPDIPAIADINELTKQTQSEVQAAGIEQAIHLLDLEGKLLLRDARAQRLAKQAAESLLPSGNAA